MLNSVQWSCINHLIAYEMSPPDHRLSHEQFCERVGISRKTLERYQMLKYECECGAAKESIKELSSCGKCGSGNVTMTPVCPEFIEALDSARKEAAETHDFFALRTRQWALEELVNLYFKCKTTSEKRKILADIRKETEDVAAITQVVDYTHLPDSELENMMLNSVTDSERAFAMTIAGEVK